MRSTLLWRNASKSRDATGSMQIVFSHFLDLLEFISNKVDYIFPSVGPEQFQRREYLEAQKTRTG